MADIVDRRQIRSDDHEYVLSLAAFIVALSGHGIIGLILSAIALNKSHHEGRKNVYALVGLIVGIAFSALTILMIGFYLLIFGASILTSIHY